MHYQNETGSQVITLASPQMVQFSTSNQNQDSIPACICCGSTRVQLIERDRDEVWACEHGHIETEVDDAAVMPEYVLAALAELADCYGPYDFAGDTLRDESGRAA